jgi:hypothetical protein
MEFTHAVRPSVDDVREGWARLVDADAEQVARVREIDEGVTMVTAHDPNDRTGSARTRLYLPLFRDSAAPDPASGDWSAWTGLLAARESLPGTGPGEAMTVVTGTPFGTLSSALIGLAAPGLDGAPAAFRFADGRPGEVPYLPVE